MKLKYLIESLFFVSLKPLTIKDLASFLKKEISEVGRAMAELIAEYNDNDRGVRIIESGKKYQMASSPDNAKLVRDFLQSEVSGELTPASLETLTIIAYRGPIKKSELEKIRGINCSLILRNLLIRGLIEEKSSDLSDENEYAVSLEFIKFLGISSLKDLPDYEKFNNNEDIDRLLGRDILTGANKSNETEEMSDLIEDSDNNKKSNDIEDLNNLDSLEEDEGEDFDDDNDDDYEEDDDLNNLENNSIEGLDLYNDSSDDNYQKNDDNFVDRVFKN